MTLWCRDIPTVNVPQAAAPKRVTLVYPYYESPTFFTRQLEHWRAYPQALRDRLSIIVVDDGSPTPAVLPSGHRLDLRLFRIDTDIRWNWLAARNIGAHHADEGWLLLTDMDHVVPTETLEAVQHGDHAPSVVYVFQRREHTGEVIHPHSASFLMHRGAFWAVGGYDETLSGHYGSDGDWRRRVAQRFPMRLLPDALIRYEYVDDSSVTRYQRKQPEDARVRQLVAARRPGWRPKVLSFPYHEVAA